MEHSVENSIIGLPQSGRTSLEETQIYTFNENLELFGRTKKPYSDSISKETTYR